LLIFLMIHPINDLILLFICPIWLVLHLLWVYFEVIVLSLLDRHQSLRLLLLECCFLSVYLFEFFSDLELARLMFGTNIIALKWSFLHPISPAVRSGFSTGPHCPSERCEKWLELVKGGTAPLNELLCWCVVKSYSLTDWQFLLWFELSEHFVL